MNSSTVAVNHCSHGGRGFHRNLAHAEHRLQWRSPRPGRLPGGRIEPALGQLAHVPLEHSENDTERRRTVADFVRGPGGLQGIEYRLVLLQPGHPPLVRRSRRPGRIEGGLRPLQLVGQEHELHAGEVEVRLIQ
ncbi:MULTISPECIES: hypothetical protein [unclassified Streptomyces]|uniref:hypothetical protein n=1 Tax=unclassified Streptomyces TaxID=2593676 RepID=UPI0023668608|nr:MULTISPECIES: hypothetical protein [unclassified Streptomyces]MDF3142047.1 hypothetical protein [Streptomyces sp. T21Q-yed]WDF36195.1 hypothetical protein PBV52_05125 [Streptomyces sp. T12]